MKKIDLLGALKPWIVIATGGLFYCYQFLIRVSPNVMHNELLEIFAIDVLSLGFILGAYNWAYSFMQIPLGLGIDRFGPKKFLFGASLLCAFSCFIFSLVSSPFMAGVARFLMGMGSACGLIGTIKLGTLWLKPKHLGKVVGLTMLLGTIGATLGGTPLSIFVDKYGFRLSMQVLGLVGLVISLMIFLLTKNSPSKLVPQKHGKTSKDLMLLMKNPQTWLLGIYGMLMYAPITLMGVGWGVPFVESACQTSEASAGGVITTMFLGAAFGGPVFTIFSDMIKNRRLPMLFGSVTCAILYFVIFLVPNIPLILMYILFFTVGFLYTAKVLTFAAICEIMPLKISGLAVAFINALVMASGILFHPLIGFLISWHNQQNIAKDSYTLEDFRFALMLIPIAITISGFLLVFIKESYPKNLES